MPGCLLKAALYGDEQKMTGREIFLFFWKFMWKFFIQYTLSDEIRPVPKEHEFAYTWKGINCLWEKINFFLFLTII